MISLAETAEITGLGEGEILWAIEKERRCDTDTHIVVGTMDVAEVMASL